MQVSTVIAGPYSHHSAGRADPGAALEGLLRCFQSTRADEKSLASYRLRRGARPGVILVIVQA